MIRLNRNWSLDHIICTTLFQFIVTFSVYVMSAVLFICVLRNLCVICCLDVLALKYSDAILILTVI